MNYVTNGFSPKEVLEIFEDICAIPHGSGNESGVADYIEGFARYRTAQAMKRELRTTLTHLP